MKRVFTFLALLLLSIYSIPVWAQTVELCLSGSGDDSYESINTLLYELKDGSKLYKVQSNSNNGLFYRTPATAAYYTYFIKTDANNNVQSVFTDSTDYGSYLVEPTDDNEVVLLKQRGAFDQFDNPISVYSYAVIGNDGQVMLPFTDLDTLTEGYYFLTARVITLGEGHYTIYVFAYYSDHNQTSIGYLYRSYNVQNYQVVSKKDFDLNPPPFYGIVNIDARVVDSNIVILKDYTATDELPAGTAEVQVFNAQGDTLLHVMLDSADFGVVNCYSSLLYIEPGKIWVHVVKSNIDDLFENESIYAVDIPTRSYKKIFYKEGERDYFGTYVLTRSPHPYIILARSLSFDSISVLCKLTGDSLQEIYEFNMWSDYLSRSKIFQTPDSGLLVMFTDEYLEQDYHVFRFNKNGMLINNGRFPYSGSSHTAFYSKYLYGTDDLVIYSNNTDDPSFTIGGIEGIIDYNGGELTETHVLSGTGRILNVFENNNGEIFTLMSPFYDSPCFPGTGDIVVYKVKDYHNSYVDVWTYVDHNSNSVKDPGENWYNKGWVRYNAGSGYEYQLIRDGFARIGIDTTKTHFNILLSDNIFTLVPDSTTIKFDDPYMADTIFFALQPNGMVFNAGITLYNTFVTRPGFNGTYATTYSNSGNQVIDTAIVKIILDDRLSITSASQAYTVSGDTLIFAVYNIPPGASGNLYIGFIAASPTELNSGDTISSYAYIQIRQSDADQNDNKSLFSEIVRGSYDPNDKNVNKDKLPLNATEFLVYTIRFENIGNDTAFNVVIKDTLPENLDWTTLEVISSSHDFTLSVENERILTFLFSQIHLPAKSQNADLSHGYITFRIKPVQGAVAEYEIKNTAHVVFDYNVPVTTNTATTRVQIVTALHNNPSLEKYINIYPNPSQDKLVVDLLGLHNQKIQLNLFDLAGKLLQSQITTATQTILDISQLAAGEYLLQAGMEGKIMTKKLIILK